MTDDPKLLNLLGIARRAGKLSCGHDGAIDAIRARRARLCLLSSDAAARLQAEIRREAAFDGREIPVFTLHAAMAEIGHATGLRSAVVTVNDEGFAKAMNAYLSEHTSGEVHL